MTSKLRAEILAELKRRARPAENAFDEASYLGNEDFSYHVRNPEKREIARQFLKSHPDLSADKFLDLLDSLYCGKSHDEKSMAGLLLEYSPAFRVRVQPERMDEWLDRLVGWGQVDSLCQSLWSGEEILSDFGKWKRFLTKLSRDKNINKRRASLVLLTKPAKTSSDERIVRLAFDNISRLEPEREILITKAVSWLLRSLTALHPGEVKTYLKKHAGSLPKIAIRETTRKLATGRK